MLTRSFYTYGAFGNLSSITTNGTPCGLAVNQLANRISGSGYDAPGSMTSWGDGGTTYSYADYLVGKEFTPSSQAMAGDLTVRHARWRCATAVPLKRTERPRLPAAVAS